MFGTFTIDLLMAKHKGHVGTTRSLIVPRIPSVQFLWSTTKNTHRYGDRLIDLLYVEEKRYLVLFYDTNKIETYSIERCAWGLF